MDSRSGFIMRMTGSKLCAATCGEAAAHSSKSGKQKSDAFTSDQPYGRQVSLIKAEAEAKAKATAN